MTLVVGSKHVHLGLSVHCPEDKLAALAALHLIIHHAQELAKVVSGYELPKMEET